ncbi:MAG: hypothetical protein A2076_13815 [Geobacteraceae bacterium GWC2_53_11]|nr:MAG: hypothetical protein A2076_13815 [Geobacteraceae bacterium GWC2_53_11]
MTRYLIVDDHAVVRRGVAEIIQETVTMEATIDEASTGQEALLKSYQNDYDLILLDISMPGSNGLEVLRDIKANKPDVPVLILSMYPEDQYALRAFTMGAAGYLNKYSAPGELVSAIEQIEASGKYVSPAAALVLANAASRGRRQLSAPHEQLSNREMEVACLIAGGKAVKQIAVELSLSVKTVNTHRSRLLKKLGLVGNVELATYFLRNKLVT